MQFYNDGNKINIESKYEEQLLAKEYINADDIVLKLGSKYSTFTCIVSYILNNKNNLVVIDPNKDDIKSNFNIVKGIISNKSENLIKDVYGSIIDLDLVCIYSLNEIKLKYNIENFSILIVGREKYFQDFICENISFLDQLRIIIFELNFCDKYKYDKIEKILRNKGFECEMKNFHSVWKKNKESFTSYEQINLFEIPLYYISFYKDEKLENNFKKIGFKNVNQFKAIDGRKFDVDTLFHNNKISIRSYNDLIIGREQHSGLPSLGAVGCTMSHYKLWKKCLEDNLPFIIIAEDDVIIKNFSKDVQNKIIKIISKPNAIFLSPHSCKLLFKKPITQFWGLSFYIISKGACEQLVKYAFPIDVQTDYYIAHLDTIKKVNVEGFNITSNNGRPTSIQTDIHNKKLYSKDSINNKDPLYIYFIYIIMFILLFCFIYYIKVDKR